MNISERYLQPHVHCSIIHNSQDKIWKTLKCPLIDIRIKKLCYTHTHSHTHTHTRPLSLSLTEILPNRKKKVIMLFTITWINLKGIQDIIPSEKSQRKTNTLVSLIYRI